MPLRKCALSPFGPKTSGDVKLAMITLKICRCLNHRNPLRITVKWYKLRITAHNRTVLEHRNIRL